MTEILYDKDGNELQKNAVYEFQYSNDGTGGWVVGRLTGIYPYKSRPFGVSDQDFDFRKIRKCQAPLGEIHKKPVELIEGQWYKFNTKNPDTDRCVGMFYGKDNIFNTGFGILFDVKECTDITRMVEAKDNDKGND